MPEISSGLEGFRVRCPVPKGFRAYTEQLCRSTTSPFDPVRTLLPGVAQSVKLLTQLVGAAPSASGHLAQRERRLWVYPGRRTLPFVFGGSSAVGTGQAFPRALPFLLLLLPLHPELLLVDLVHVSCVCGVRVFCFLLPPRVDIPSG